MEHVSGSLAEPKSFEQFFREYYNRLVLYAIKFVDDRQVASDLVQEAFVKLWEGRQGLSVNVSLKAYIFKVVHNLCLNYIEQQKIRERHHAGIYDELKEMEASFFAVEKSILQKELGDIIEKSVNVLPDDYKEIIELSRFRELKVKEIAKILDQPVRTIETRIYRALKQLREEISKRLKD